MEEEVACLDLGPGEDSALLGVGLWTDISVRVLRLPDLTPLHTEKLSGGNLLRLLRHTLPRSDKTGGRVL